MLDVTLYLAGQVVSLINDSPRVEGNNITVDLRTDHPVQCGIRLATMASPLRDCELMNYYSVHFGFSCIPFVCVTCKVQGVLTIGISVVEKVSCFFVCFFLNKYLFSESL